MNDHCPICGARITASGHDCPPATLAKIDAAHRGAELEPGRTTQVPSFGQRLADGFRRMTR